MRAPTAEHTSPRRPEDTLWKVGLRRRSACLAIGHNHFCGFGGSATRMPVTGNVLVDFAAILVGSPDHPVRVFEVTHTDPPEVVLDLGFEGQVFVYRASRIPTLYPPGVLLP